MLYEKMTHRGRVNEREELRLLQQYGEDDKSLSTEQTKFAVEMTNQQTQDNTLEVELVRITHTGLG